MPDLSCHAVNCIHNADHCCCKSEIRVDGSKARKKDHTCCGSFDYDGEADAPRNASEEPHLKLSVDCEAAHCIYNEDFRCRADHIDISGSSADHPEGTLCETFRTR